MPKELHGYESSAAGRASGLQDDPQHHLGSTYLDAAMEDIMQNVIEIVNTVLGLQDHEYDVSDPFPGLDSRNAIKCHRAIEERTGYRLPPTVLLDHPTANSLSNYMRTYLQSLHHSGSTHPAVIRTQLHNQQQLDELGDDLAMECSVLSISIQRGLPSLELQQTSNISAHLSDVFRDAIKPTPLMRWDLDQLRCQHLSTNPATFGAYISDVEHLDASAFKLMPSETILMDPQQRLLLELSWEALERASRRGSATHVSDAAIGVFVGIFFDEYATGVLQGDQMTRFGNTPFRATGISASVASGRLAFTYGLHGPALSVQTACSSSLVTMHLAHNSITKAKDTSGALAAGVNCLLDAGITSMFSGAGMLAPDGRCKALDASADGYVRAEAAGMIFISSSSSSHHGDGLAKLAGTAVNQDGRSQSLTGELTPAYSDWYKL
eukprot:gene815-1293_t